MEDIFIYPLNVEYDLKNKCLLYDCLYRDIKGVQQRTTFKYLDYKHFIKVIAKKELTNKQIDKYIKSVINDNFINYEINNGYNLFNPMLDNAFNPTNRYIYKIYIERPLRTAEIKKINKNLLVVEEEINYTKLKYQKDTNIFLFKFNKITLFNNVIVDCVEYHEELEPEKMNLNICCYDIETWYNTEENDFYSKIYNDYIGSICLKLNNDKPIILIINKNTQGKKEFENYIRIIFKTEKELIKYFVDNYFNSVKVNVCYGYNNSGFDDKAIIQRYNTLFNEELIINNSVIHYDLYQYIKKTFSCSSYTLKDQLNKHFNNTYNKIDLSYNELQKIFNKYHRTQNINELNELIEYNIRDTEGTHKLENKLNGLNNYIAISKLSSVSINNFIDKQLSTIILNYIYKILPENIYIYNVNPNKTKYTGAYVDLTTDKKGFYKNAYPFDFKSLYPSMMMFYNLSPDTITTKDNKDKSFKWIVDNKEYYFLKPEYYKGFFTELMETLGKTRTQYKKLMKVNKSNKIKYNPLQTAIKLIMNSIYGKLGEQIRGKSNFNLSNRQIAETITTTGQHNIKLLQKLLSGIIPEKQYSLQYEKRDKDFKNIQNILKTSKFLYTDTDSVYIILNNNSITINDIEHKYLSKLFINPIYAEAEDKIDYINIVKKKYYIYQTEDGKIHTKGWKRNEIKLLKDYHKETFKEYQTLKGCIKEMIKDKFNTYKNKIRCDNKLLQNRDITDELKYNILEKYYINKQLTDQQHTREDTERLYKKCEIKLKKYTEEQKLKMKNDNINTIKNILKCNEEDLGIITTRTTSPFYIYQYKQKKEMIKSRINCIQIKDHYKNPILNKIKSINCVNVDMLNNPFEIDENYYITALKNRIKKSILTTF